MTTLAWYGIILLGLVVVDWPWHRRGLRTLASIVRIAMVLVASVMLVAAADIGPARRRAYTTADRVTTLRGAEVSPYLSGVLTMNREAGEDLDGIFVPLIVLAWLGLLPGARALFRLVGERLDAGERPAEVTLDE